MDWLSAIAGCSRRYPFFGGASRLAGAHFMRTLTEGRSEPRWVTSPGGELRVSLDDLLGRCVFFFGDYDPKLTWILRRILRPGDRAIDVGANVGLLTLLMARLVAPHGTVDAFEPNPILCGSLTAAVNRNALADTITVHQTALGSSQGITELHVPTGNSGGGSLNRKGLNGSQTYSVNLAKLDDLKLGRPDIIKIDAEGAEYDVLSGAMNLLKRSRPIVVVETEVKEESGRVIALLRDAGYDFLSIPRRLFRMKTERFTAGSITHDIIAAPRGETFAEMCRALRAD